MPLFRSTREPTDPLVADLTAALDADRVRADGAQRSLAAHDASVFDGGVAGPPVLMPCVSGERRGSG